MTVLDHPQSVQAIFFDAGYTLLAPHPTIADIIAAACAPLGISISPACIEKHTPAAEAVLNGAWKTNPALWSDNGAIREVWERYFTRLLSPCLGESLSPPLSEIVARVVDAFESASSYALYPDVVPVLARLKQRNVKLGIISDWGVNLGLIVRHHDLVPYFDFTVISAAVRHAKPDPALFRTALHRADVIPDYTLHIGDSYVLDVLGARAAGITGVLLDRQGKYASTPLDCPLVRDLHELLDLLEIGD